MAQALERPPAKDLTPEEVTERRKIAFDLDLRIKATLAAQADVEWAVAESLYRFEQMKGWRWLNLSSAVEYCAQPEVSMEKSKYYAYVALWRELVVAGRIPHRVETLPDGLEVTRVPDLEGASPRKVVEVLPAIVKGQVPVEEALSDAKTLGARDLREQYRQSDPGNKQLDATREPERAICPVCGRWAHVEDLEGYEMVDGELRLVVIDGTGEELGDGAT